MGKILQILIIENRNLTFTVTFCAQFACRLTSGQSGRTKEPLARPGAFKQAVIFYDPGFSESSGAADLSQVSKMLRQLRVCLHGGGEPQVGDVTRLGGVKK